MQLNLPELAINYPSYGPSWTKQLRGPHRLTDKALFADEIAAASWPWRPRASASMAHAQGAFVTAAAWLAVTSALSFPSRSFRRLIFFQRFADLPPIFEDLEARAAAHACKWPADVAGLRLPGRNGVAVPWRWKPLPLCLCARLDAISQLLYAQEIIEASEWHSNFVLCARFAGILTSRTNRQYLVRTANFRRCCPSFRDAISEFLSVHSAPNTLQHHGSKSC